MFRDSGRTAYTRPVQCSSMALGRSKAKAPTKGLSKLNSMAFGLAAGTVRSMVGITRFVTSPSARLTSGRWSGATGRAFHPQGSYERFQICFLTSHPPFPSFAWHNDRDLCTLAIAVRRGGLNDRSRNGSGTSLSPAFATAFRPTIRRPLPCADGYPNSPPATSTPAPLHAPSMPRPPLFKRYRFLDGFDQQSATTVAPLKTALILPAKWTWNGCRRDLYRPLSRTRKAIQFRRYNHPVQTYAGHVNNFCATVLPKTSSSALRCLPRTPYPATPTCAEPSTNGAVAGYPMP
jgi:hypothetical protein